MNSIEFEKLIKKDKYQIFIFTCPASLPASFVPHPWIVINKKGELSRWEVKHFKNKDKDLGYLYINDRPPLVGLSFLFPFKKLLPWKAELLGLVEGDENQEISKIIDFIEHSKENYPYLKKYSFLGPNSNTYVNWVLKEFPNLKIELPWNCLGKSYIK